jgi:dUTP pyrophosphatase
MKIKVQYQPDYQPTWPRLAYAKDGDAGFDLRAAIPQDRILHQNQTEMIPLGIKLELPISTDPDYVWELQVSLRSSMAKAGLILVNGVGVVDQFYRGEIMAPIANLNKDAYVLKPGDRITQGVLIRAYRAVLEEGHVDTNTARGEGGFGSTGRG